MSVIVTGMDMPDNCFDCKVEGLLRNCPCKMGYYSASDYRDSRCPDCPIISVDSVIEQMEVAKFVDPYGIDRDKRYNDGIRACIAILRGLEDRNENYN